MITNINSIIAEIKKVGPLNTRVVSDSDNKCRIEIKSGDNWQPIITGITNLIADNIIKEATNKVILG